MGCSSSLAAQTKNLKNYLPEIRDWKKLDELPLSATQKEYIKCSWVVLEQKKSELGIEIFLRLFEENPSLQLDFPEFRHIDSLEELRQSAYLQGHTKRVMKVVENAVSSLGDVHYLMEYLRELGRRHRTRQIRPKVDDLQLISKAIKTTFEDCLGCRWTVEVAESWNSLLDFITAMIIQGLRSPKN